MLGFVAARLRLPPLVGYLLAGVVIGPGTPGFVADVNIAGAAGRDRRDAADVRRRPALLAGRPAVGAQDRVARRHRADRGGHRAGRAALALWWGWDLPGGAGVRPGAVGGQHGGAAARRSRARACSTARTAASPSAGWWSRTWRWCWCWCCCRRWPALLGGRRRGRARRTLWHDARPYAAARSARFVALMLVVGPARVPVAAVAGHAHRLARAVHAVRGGGGREHRVRLGAAVRRVVRARRILRRHGAARIGVQPPRGQETLPLRDAFAVLFFVSVGMLFDPMVLVDEPLRVLAVWRSSWSASRSPPRCWCCCCATRCNTALTVSASLAQIGEFSFILAGSASARACCPTEGAEPDPGRRADLDRAQPAGVRRDRAAAALAARALSTLARQLEQRDDPLAELPMTTDAQVPGATRWCWSATAASGARIAQALYARSVPFVVADQNRELVERLRAEGRRRGVRQCGRARDAGAGPRRRRAHAGDRDARTVRGAADGRDARVR